MSSSPWHDVTIAKYAKEPLAVTDTTSQVVMKLANTSACGIRCQTTQGVSIAATRP